MINQTNKQAWEGTMAKNSELRVELRLRKKLRKKLHGQSLDSFFSGMDKLVGDETTQEILDLFHHNSMVRRWESDRITKNLARWRICG